jgi:hypothetical protein
MSVLDVLSENIRNKISSTAQRLFNASPVGMVYQGFQRDIPRAQQAIQSFGQYHPTATNFLMKAEPVHNAVQNFVSSIPQNPVSLQGVRDWASTNPGFSGAPTAVRNVLNIPLKATVGLGTGIAEGFANALPNIAYNAYRVPFAQTPQQMIGRTAGILEGVGTLASPNVLKKSVTSVINQPKYITNPLWSSIKQGAVEGAKYGGIFGALGGAKQNQDSAWNQLVGTAQGTATGVVMGGALGGALAGFSRIGKVAIEKIQGEARTQAKQWTETLLSMPKEQRPIWMKQMKSQKQVEDYLYSYYRNRLALEKINTIQDQLPQPGMTVKAINKPTAKQTMESELNIKPSIGGEIPQKAQPLIDEMRKFKSWAEFKAVADKSVHTPEMGFGSTMVNEKEIPIEAQFALNDWAKAKGFKTGEEAFQAIKKLSSSTGGEIQTMKAYGEEILPTTKKKLVEMGNEILSVTKVKDSRGETVFNIKYQPVSGGEIGGVKPPQMGIETPKGVNTAQEKQLVPIKQPLKNQKSPLAVPDTSTPIISPNVYNAQPSEKMIGKLRVKNDKLVQNQQGKDFKEWSNMIFKQEGAIIKTKEKALITTIGKNIEQSTNKSAQKALEIAQIEAKKTFVTNKKGNVILSKGGSPINRDVVIRAENWKDKPRLSYARETMERNFEDIMGKDAPGMKAQYIEPVYKAEANRMRWLNKERADIKSLGIAPRSQESKAVQQLGEGLITKDQAVKLPNGEKIINAESFLRKKYDSYLTEINTVLTRNGYDPIPKRQDYFRHFTEIKGLLEQVGIPMRENALPTDINGLTADFRPGKNFFASALQRKTNITDYDAIQGIDTYLDGASKQIFHTDNIQNLRLLDKSLRETFAGTTHLSNFVADLTEYTNTLAGKKAMIDRSVESALGRGIYAGADRLRRQAGTNMVGANVASSLTNYIPFTQALAVTDKPSFAKGMLQTIASTFKDDGFVNRSDFLSSRQGSDRLATNLWGKIGNKSMWLFKVIDNFVSGTIVRGKYAEGMTKGMSPVKAMQYADGWARKIMAGRALGEMPTMFNSKTLGLLSQFQLEVNNQMSFMFKDIPRNYNTTGAASALGQVFLYSYIFNNVYEKAFGRRPAFDPIGVVKQTYEDYTNPDMKKGQATKNLISNVSNQLPFTSALTGGRIPIGSAIPNPIAVATGDSTAIKEAKKLFYLLPPTGGGQLKKTIEGVGAYTKGGSMTDLGRVRYPIPQTPVNAIRTAVGGQYSTPEAVDYFRQGKTALGEKQSSVFNESQDKVGTYNSFMDTRANDKRETEIKQQVLGSGQEQTYNGKKFYLSKELDSKTGQYKPVVKSIGVSSAKATKVGNLSVSTREEDKFPFPDYSQSAPGQTLRADLNFNGNGNADIVLHFKSPNGQTIDVPQTQEAFNGGKNSYGLEMKIPSNIPSGKGEIWVTVNGQEIAGTRKAHEIISGQNTNRYGSTMIANDPTMKIENVNNSKSVLTSLQSRQFNPIYNGDTYSDVQIKIPEVPKYTGMTELDKQLKSKYTSALSTAKTNIGKLYLDGQLTAQEANDAIQSLTSASGSGGKKVAGLKPTFKKYTIKKPKLAKFAKPKKTKVPKLAKIKSLPKNKVKKLQAKMINIKPLLKAG